MLCTVLGPLSVNGVIPGSPQQRRLLAALAVHRRSPVSVDLLSEVVWQGAPPATALNSLQSKVSRLRTSIGNDRVRRVPAGYLLDLDVGECDADRFEDLLTSADGLGARDELAVLDDALALWHGAAFAEFADEEFARPAAVRLEGRRLGAHERRLHCLLELGRIDDVIASTAELTEIDPYREGFWSARIRAFALAGRSVEAVRCYQDVRARFIDETGLEPSARLADLERAVIAGEVAAGPAVVAPVPGRATAASPPGPPPGRPPGDDEPVGRESSPWRSLTATSLAVAPLVEREDARGRMRAALDQAASGRPAMVLFSGEAGIGKTRMVDIAVTSARGAGARVLTGRCIPEFRTALGPFGSLASALGVQALGPTSGARGAPDPADLGELVVDRDPTSATTTLVRALLDALAGSFTVLVLEDLHWADSDTATALDLFLAEAETRAAVGDLSLLVVGTHRRLDGAVPGHATLDRIGRVGFADRIELAPLTESGTAALLHAMTGLHPTSAMVRRLLTSSDGNPLVLLGILDRWVASGAVRARAGAVDVALGSEPDAGAPADILSSVLDRLDLLDAAEIDILTAMVLAPLAETVRPVATVVGIVAATLDCRVDTVVDALIAASDRGLVRLDHDAVRWTDPRLRGVLMDRLALTRRAHLLRRLVAVLIDADGFVALDPDFAAPPALVVHVLHAARELERTWPDDDLLAEWALAALEQSVRAGAWGDAAHQSGVALEHGATVLDDGTPLTFLAGTAHFRDHDESRARPALDRAVADAQAAGDTVTEGRALLVRHRIAMALTDSATGTIDPLASSAELRRYVAHDTGSNSALLRARGAAQLAEEAFARDDLDDAHRHLDDARRLANEDDLAVVLAEVDFAEGLIAIGSLDLTRADRLLDRSVEGALAAGDPWVASWGAGRLALRQLLVGDRRQARRAIDRALDLQLPLRFWSELTLTRALEAAMAGAQGEWHRSMVLAEESERLAIRSSYPFAHAIALPVLACGAVARGDADAADAALARLAEETGREPWPFVALVEAGTGRLDRALERCRTRRHRLDRPLTLNWLPAVVAAATIAALSGDELLADAVAPAVDATLGRGIRMLPGWPVELDQLWSHR